MVGLLLVLVGLVVVEVAAVEAVVAVEGEVAEAGEVDVVVVVGNSVLRCLLEYFNALDCCSFS